MPFYGAFGCLLLFGSPLFVETKMAVRRLSFGRFANGCAKRLVIWNHAAFEGFDPCGQPSLFWNELASCGVCRLAASLQHGAAANQPHRGLLS